jgi:hypothetical protein
MRKVCPNCNQIYIMEKHSGDYVHECNSGIDAVDNEDVVVIGNWEDYTGSKTVRQGDIRFAGTANELFGTRAEIEGEDLEPLSERGARKSTTRTRQHYEYIREKE